MPALLGFLIALSIALTGVGAGTLSVPLLMLVLGTPAAEAVALGLTFSAAVKLLLAPAQIARGNVSWPVLRTLIVGALPGVLLGSLLLHHLVEGGLLALLNAAIGLVLIATAAIQILFHFRKRGVGREAEPSASISSRLADNAKTLRNPSQRNQNPLDQNPRTQNQRSRPKRAWLLAALMLPVGAEVGFSSAGAGALGSAALLVLTTLSPAQVIGTDILFGAILSLTGAVAHGLPLHAPLLLPMLLGGIPGAFTGLLLAARLPRRPLRLALWIVLLALGGRLLHSGLVHIPQSRRAAYASLTRSAAA